jgi:hypothetical protein
MRRAFSKMSEFEEDQIIIVMEILRLRLLRFERKQIAKKTGVHYKTVGRIIRSASRYVQRRRKIMSKNKLGGIARIV